MEPCAPGTEDDPPIMFSTLTKQENEQERLLKQKAILRNGRYENVFEFSYVNGSENWFCKACECPVMGRVFQHEVGRRHTYNLGSYNRLVDKQQKDDEKVGEEEVEAIAVAPGEPVPPGFEEEFNRVAQIQERLDGFKVGPLVALEYLVELQDYDTTKEPYYLCILCDKRGDPRTVLTHLASYNHITQYLQKHFPTCYRALAPYMTKHFKRNWQLTLQKIAEGIEKKFGRLRPFPIDKDKFEKERMQYLTIIGKGKHFSELSGYTFEELVVHDELVKSHEVPEEKSHENSTTNNWGGSTYIQKPFKKRSPSPPVVAVPSKKSKQLYSQQSNQGPATNKSSQAQRIGQNRRQSLSSVSDISDTELNEPDFRRNRPSDKKFARSPVKGRGGERQLPYLRRRSPSPRRRSLSPRSKRIKSVAEENREKEEEKLRKIEEYRKLARAIENDLQKTLKQHEKNPEKHPQYNEEWKKFWNQRYKELQSQGVDVSKHDFKPEWIQFWNRRMVELHSDELRSRKDALRKRLALPEEVNPIKFTIGSNQPKPTPPSAQPDQDNEVIVIDDKDDKQDHSRSHSPWEKESSPRPRSRRRSLSKERTRRNRSRERHRNVSRNRSLTRKVSSKSKERDLGYNRNVSRSPYRDEHSRGYSPSRDRDMGRMRDAEYRDRDRSYSRERSWERRSDVDRERDSRRMDYRESSYERDMRAKERVRTVADLPWQREKSFNYYDVYRPPHIMRDVTRRPVLIPKSSMLPEEENDDEVEVNVVNVLRILTALEERLGSLGPKIVDLLAQALALEKKEANSSETLLDNDINCVMFETIKEKLKGQMLTGLVDDLVQERAFKTAIKKIAGLIHLASQRKKKREKHWMKAKAVTVPGVGAIDRAAIAKQIANALIMQGKTDVTQAELEQLINAVVGMAEASKGSNQPMTTASFLQQLTGTQLGQHPNSESTEKIIIPTSAKRDEVAELEKLTEPLTPSPGRTPQNMENLSDSDLQTLLQNFKDLSTEEQHNLINYLKKLEYDEPERVEKLRQFVDLETGSKKRETGLESTSTKEKGSRDSPFSNRSGGVNPISEDLPQIESDEEDMNDDQKNLEQKEEKERKIHLDSEEEDYTFEDVVKTASKNVKDKQLESNMKIVEESMKLTNANKVTDLNSAKDLISNLMSNINKNIATSKSIDLLGLGTVSSASSMSTSNMLTSTADFAKTLSNINIANLTSIVNNVKSMSEEVNKNPIVESPYPMKSSESLPFKPSSQQDLSLGGEPSKIDRRLEESSHPGRLDEPGRSFSGTSNRLEEPSRPFPNPFARLDDRGFSGPGGRSDDIGRPFSGPVGTGPSMRGPNNQPVERRDLYSRTFSDMSHGSGRDMALGSGRNMLLGQGGDLSHGSDRDIRLGPSRDLSLSSNIDSSMGPNRDLGMHTGRDLGMNTSRELGMNTSRDLSMGPGRDLGMGSGRDLGMGPGRDFGMGPGRDLGMGLGRDLGMGSGRDLGMGPGRDLGMGPGRDLGMGPSRDLGLGPGRDLGMGPSRAVGMGPSRDVGMGSSRDLGMGSGRELGMGSGRDLGMGPGRDFAMGSGRDLGMGPGRDLTMGLGKDLGTGPGRDLAMSSGRGLGMGPGRDLASSSGRDLGMGSGRDLAIASGRDLSMGPGRDLPIDPNSNMPFGREGSTGFSPRDRPLGSFPRGQAPGLTNFGNNLLQTQVRGPRLNLLDRRNDQRFNNYGDFSRPSGNFNRW